MLRDFFKNVIYFLRDGYCSFFNMKSGAVVLMYHSVGNGERFFAVTPAELEKQLNYLKENNFNVISLDKFFNQLSKGRVADKTVCITFDDGNLDNYEIAYPLLKKYNFPATMFVITDFIGKEIERRDTKSKFFSWEDSKIMERSGLIDIEPHTMSHIKLHYSSEDDINREIIGSKKKIEEILNKKCLFFAYPSGRYNDKVIELVRKAGFSMAFTVEKGVVNSGDNFLALKRNSVDSRVSFYQFKKIVIRGRVS